MGLIFNRGSENKGCRSHHLGEAKPKSIEIDATPTPYNPFHIVKISKEEKCVHKGCNYTEERTSWREVKITDKDEVWRKLLDAVDEIKEEAEKGDEE